MNGPRHPLLLILVLVGIAATGVPHLSAEPLPSGLEIGARAVDAEAAARLRDMTPEEIETLDAFLAKALVHYYDREYALALPIFRELAEKVETMDIMFWIGTSAAAVGDTELAIAKFRRMLTADPDLHRVRLELASVYFDTGRYAGARRELKTVLDTDPPPEVAANVRRMLAAIDARTRRHDWNLRLATGWMWDDNVSSGPDPGVYTFAGGTAFTPSATAAKLRDEASVTSFAGNYRFDPGQRRGLMWNTAASAYLKAYQTHGQFNYQMVDVSTGPWWVSGDGVLKVPAGIAYSQYASDRLSYMLHLDPGYTHFFTPAFSLSGTYRLRAEKFYEPARANDYDGTSQVFELSPTIYVQDRRHMISAVWSWESHRAQNEANAYEAPTLGLSYLLRLPTATEIFLSYRWNRRDYEGLQAFPYAGLEREDTRNTYTAVLSQTLFRYFNLSYAVAFTDNRSNLALNRWDKTTHTLSVGCQF